MNHWRRSILIGVTAVLILGACLPQAFAQGHRFAGIACLDVVVEAMDSEAEALGITAAGLKTGLFVRLKAKLPRLDVHDSCREYLYLNVNVGTLRGSARGYYGNVLLLLTRQGTLAKTDRLTTVIVWHTGSIFSGSISAQDHALRVTDELLDSFAEAYYKAGNP
jgi:hypothetical protein